MIILFRIFLVSLIVYLLVRSFTGYNNSRRVDDSHSGPNGVSPDQSRRISKDTGEYIDYEEVD